LKIKDEYVLANHMGRALSNYANQVQNGNVRVFRGFLDGAESVDATITLHDDGSISMKLYEPPVIQITEQVPEEVYVCPDPIMEKPKQPRRKKKQSEN
jgi:hypothetical protein